jgi:hypothetical protein
MPPTILYLYLPPKKRYTSNIDVFNSYWQLAQVIHENHFFCQIEAEASSVETVAARLCPLNIVLDRVVLTSTGVLLGCWQVIFHNLNINNWPRYPSNMFFDMSCIHPWC